MTSNEEDYLAIFINEMNKLNLIQFVYENKILL